MAGLDIYLSLSALAVSSIALLLYLRSWLRIELTIIKVECIPNTAKEKEYIIRAFVSNEGGTASEDCQCEVRINDISKDGLDWSPVEGPNGGIGLTKKIFKLYPRRPISLRGYYEGKIGSKVELLLIGGKRFCFLWRPKSEPVVFELPERD